MFLLGCAALANMTFMDTMACDMLLLYHTAKVLVDACGTTNADSLFAKDQVMICFGLDLEQFAEVHVHHSGLL